MDTGDGQARSAGQVDQLVRPGRREATAVGHQQSHVCLELEPFGGQAAERRQQGVDAALLPGPAQLFRQLLTLLPCVLGHGLVSLVALITVVCVLGHRVKKRGNLRAGVIYCHEAQSITLIAQNKCNTR